MIDYIRSIDQLGKEFKLSINGGTFNTLTGGILTILISITLIVLCWYFGQDIYLKRSPHLLKSEKLLPKYPYITLNTTSFKTFIAFVLKHHKSYGSIQDPRFFDYYLRVHIRREMLKTGRRVKKDIIIRAVNCTTDHIDEETYKSQNFGEYMCVDNSKYLIGGHVTEKIILI